MRFFTGFLIVIGLIVLLFVAILKHGSGGPKVQPFNLNSYATSGAVVQLTIDGPINADSQHQMVQISVGATQTTFQILQGYQGRVQTSKSFESNQTAFTVFLHALTVAGFASGRSNAQPSDERGYCSQGDRYIFELSEDGSDILRYWAASCGGEGNYRGNLAQTLADFKAQVPNYSNLTASVPL